MTRVPYSPVARASAWRRPATNAATSIALILYTTGCLAGGGAASGETPLAIDAPGPVANDETLAAVARQFYESAADDYDMLVLWGSREMGPGHAFYLPVRNDVRGIGEELEVTSRAETFGSSTLQGVVWMGPDLLDAPESDGPGSLLDTLAHETAHRWGASIGFLDEGGEPSTALVGRPAHWSFLLDTGASPLGGNDWRAAGEDEWVATPVSETRFAPIDLYLMGLRAAADVPPLRLVTGPIDAKGHSVLPVSPLAPRVERELAIQAVVREVHIEQIVAFEGERSGGFGAHEIRQVFVHVTTRGEDVAAESLRRMQRAAAEWPDYFATATEGAGRIALSSPR